MKQTEKNIFQYFKHNLFLKNDLYPQETSENL